MHPRADAKFRAHVAPLLATGETLHAGVRAVTGGFISRQNAAVLAAFALFAAVTVLRFYVIDVKLYGWLDGFLVLLFVVPAILIAHRLHAAARARRGRGSAPKTAEVLRRSTLLMAVTDRRLLVFARKGSTGYGPLLAAYPLKSIGAARRIASRAFPVRLPVVHIALAEGDTLDLELLGIDRPDAFIAALEAARAAGGMARPAAPV